MAGHGTRCACPHHCSAKEASGLGGEDQRAAAISTAIPFLGNARRFFRITTGKLFLVAIGAQVDVGPTALLEEQVGSWRTRPQWGIPDQPWQ